MLEINHFFKLVNSPHLMRERIGGVPYETKKSGGSVEIRFYPKGENAKNPDGIVFMLSLSKEDRKKLTEIIS